VSSALPISIIMVLLLATTAFGLIAYSSMNLPAPISVQAAPAPEAPPTTVYFVARYPLTEGTVVRDEYFRSAPLAEAPSGAFRDTPNDMSKLRGSLVRKFVYAGDAITSEKVMLRNDQGFLAALEKLCQDDRQKATVTVSAGDKVKVYSIKNSKASEACAELERQQLPMTSARSTL